MRVLKKQKEKLSNTLGKALERQSLNISLMVKNIKSIYYSYVSHFSTLFSSTKVSAKDNLLDTKLRLRGNAMVSLNTLMHDNFPLGTEMMVYYNPKQPKLAYVERYAPNYLWKI